MSAGGFAKLPNGTVVVALNLPCPDPTRAEVVRILVHAQNRSRALTRLRNLGLRAVYLRGNAAPPTLDEITAVLHHPDGLIWRTAPAIGTCPDAEAGAEPEAPRVPELWHPIRALFTAPPAAA